MAAAEKPFISPVVYLAIERSAAFKSEYVSGQMFAMAGASREHGEIVTNVLGELRNRLRGGDCRAVGNDLRVQVTATGMFTYPDVVVYCGDAIWLDSHHDTLTNPVVIFEVLSPSTARIDRGEKFLHYRRLESLTDYVIVAQDRCQIEHFRRQGRDWVFVEVLDLEGVVNLAALGVALPVAEIYAGLRSPEDG